jgi:hypothetical protein
VTTGVALTWEAFARAEPALAGAGRALLYQVGPVGLAFLSTVRRDGGPRLHPVCPVLFEEGLYAFLVPSPKRSDLVRDGRFALHSYPTDDNEDAFYVTGTAARRTEQPLRDAIAAQWFQERGMSAPPPGFDEEWLFEFRLRTCLLTRTTGHGDFAPQHTVWRAGPAA